MATLMDTPAELVVVRSEPYAALERVLDDAVARDPTLAPARALLLMPLRLLDALGKDAPAALGDDTFAMERMRLLLSMASTHVPASIVRDVLGETGGAALTGATAAFDAPLVHVGGLVLIGLAAGRVGASLGLSSALVANVLGLALAAGPAEALTRSIRIGMTPAQVTAILVGLTSRENGNGRLAATIAAFLGDPAERSRWAALERLFAQVEKDVGNVQWDAAGADVLNVVPREACAGETIAITMQPWDTGGGVILAPAPPLTLGAPAPATPAASAPPPTMRVVFAAQAHRPVVRRPESISTDNVVTVKVPARARSGWVGFSDDLRVQQSNRDRAALRGAWDERNTTDPALRDTPVPTAAIPSLPAAPNPPRTAQARFDGGTPTIVEATIAPRIVEAGTAVRLSWRAQGAETVVIEPDVGKVEVEGSIQVTPAPDHFRIAYDVVATGRCGQSHQTLTARIHTRIKELRLLQDERTSPLVAAQPLTVEAVVAPADSRDRVELVTAGGIRPMHGKDGRLRAVLAAGEVQDGLAGVVRVLATAATGGGTTGGTGTGTSGGPGGGTGDTGFSGAPSSSGVILTHLTGAGTGGIGSNATTGASTGGGILDAREFGPLQFVVATRHQVVIIRPGLLVSGQLQRVPASAIGPVLSTGMRASAMILDVREPAWIDDEDITVDGGVEGPDVPNADALLERLELLALTSPGFEAATWLALVPTRHDHEFARVQPAEGARAVGICTQNAIAQALAQELPAPGARAPRLRICGTVHADRPPTLQPARVEKRCAGPGAQVDTGIIAVALDAKGRIRATKPVRVTAKVLPARFGVLLPLASDVVAVELRSTASPNLEHELVSLLAGVATRPYTGPLRRIFRPDGAPLIEGETVDGADLHWQYDHTRGARPAVLIELGRGDAWNPVLRPALCATGIELPLARLGPGSEAERIRVVATDGWNTATGPDLPVHVAGPATPRVIARYAGSRRFWADIDDDVVAVTWRFGDVEKTDRLVLAPIGYTGDVFLSVDNGDFAAQDVRTIAADGSLDDRSTRLPEK